MLVSRLLRSLLKFFAMGIVPDEAGGATPAPPPVVETPPSPAPAPDVSGAAPVAAPVAAPAPAAPVDQFAGLTKALENLGGAPAPAAPAVAATPVPPGAPAAPAQARDPGGRFASSLQTAAGVAAPPPVPTAAPGAPVPPPPKPGDIDLTPPEGMNERSQQRWAQLTERVKAVPELERRATEATQALDSVRQLVTSSGLAPNEFSEMLDMARLYKSASPQDAQRALQMLDGLRTELATRFGIDAPGVDALNAHPDLKQKVDGMLMTREDALEIARLRQGNQQHQQTTREQQEFQQFQNTVNQAATKLESTLAARAGTPGHDAKVAYIAQHFQNPANLQAFVKTYQPHQWESVVATMYDLYTPQAAPPPPPPVPQPLRPGAGRVGVPVRSGPVTAESAVEGAFARLGM